MNLVDSERDTPRWRRLIGDPAHAARICNILTEAGRSRWSELDADTADIDVIIFDDQGHHLRLATGISSLLPCLMLTDKGQGSTNSDEIVILCQTNEQILAQIDRWRPTPDRHRFAEVARGFGDAAIRPIARGLSDQLKQAIYNLDASDFTTAHRIAGLAGTLGFRRASKAWLAIDEGDLSDLPAARREARLAVVAIERWLAATGSARDSAG